MQILSGETPPHVQVGSAGPQTNIGIISLGVPALFGTIELSLSTCL